MLKISSLRVKLKISITMILKILLQLYLPKLFLQTICELTPISYTSKCINMQYLDSELMCYSMFYLKHCILSKYINFEFFRPDTERLVPTLLIEGFYSSSTQSYEVPNNKYIKLLNSLWNISSFTLEYH